MGRASSWVMHYVYKSPHKDRRARTCMWLGMSIQIEAKDVQCFEAKVI